MSSYEVGSVIWVIHTDKPGLMAYQVIEEITKKDLEGERVHYIIQPARPKSKPVQLDSIKGRIFQNSEDAQVILLENATRAIDGIIAKTQEAVDRHFQKQQSTAVHHQPQVENKPRTKPAKKKPDSELPGGYAWVEMDDGKKVKMKIPQELL